LHRRIEPARARHRQVEALGDDGTEVEAGEARLRPRGEPGIRIARLDRRGEVASAMASSRWKRTDARRTPSRSSSRSKSTRAPADGWRQHEGHLAPREVAHAPDALRVAARDHQALLAARPLDERHAAAPELCRRRGGD
jgi:hypothetical protein